MSFRKLPKPTLIASAVIALWLPMNYPLRLPHQFWRVTSAYSGTSHWVAFYSSPTEEELLDAVIDRCPKLYSYAMNMKQRWRQVRDGGDHLWIWADNQRIITIAPYEDNLDLDNLIRSYPGKAIWLNRRPPPANLKHLAVQEVKSEKATWLTEPATRHYIPGPVILVGGFALLYSLGFGLSVTVLLMSTYLWYFLLARLRELVVTLKASE